MTSELHPLEHDALIRLDWLQVIRARNEDLARAEARIADLEAQIDELRSLLDPASQEA
jgi:hypothetical protein